MNKYFQWFLPILCVGSLSGAVCASRGVPSAWIHDVAANTSEKYANIIRGDPHPRYPHVVFSQDGQWISFVTGMDNENSRVAIMRVDGNKQ